MSDVENKLPFGLDKYNLKREDKAEHVATAIDLGTMELNRWIFAAAYLCKGKMDWFWVGGRAAIFYAGDKPDDARLALETLKPKKGSYYWLENVQTFLPLNIYKDEVETAGSEDGDDDENI